MKKICLIGANGYVGSAIVKEALGRGHKVCGIVRNVERVVLRHPNLTLISQDVMDTERLAVKMSGYDVVISAYNPGWSDPELYEETLVGYDSILYAAHKSGIPRILIVGGAGSLYVSPGVQLMDTGKISPAILPGAEALSFLYMHHLLPNEEIDWVFFCPAASLEPGPRTGKYRLGNDYLVTNEKGESKISLEDYAMAMIDEVETPNHHRERFTIGY